MGSKYYPFFMNLGQYIAKILLEQDEEQPLIKNEMDEIERTAQELNIPISDVENAFNTGNIVTLSDDIWSKLENSDSWDIKSLEDAIELAKKYNKDWKPTLSAIKDNKTINPPLILNYNKDNYYLVGGNTRLMFYKALGITPKVLIGKLNDFLAEYSQGTINKLISKFKQENPSLSDNEIKTYINRFDSIKGNLPADKRDITKYSWNELEQVIASNQSKRIKAGKINDGEPEDANLVYNKDNLRIYVGKTKQACIKYGNGYSFCISARGEDNLYSDYRFMQQGTPYFIFDDSKSSERNEDGKFKDPNHLLVIFYYEENDEGPSQYSVTDANNIETDDYNSWEELIQYYPGQPKLKKLKNIIKPVELDSKEKAEYDLESESNNKIYDLNYVEFKDKEDFGYKIRTSEYYRIDNINQADRYIDKILNNQLVPYNFGAVLISDDNREKYATDMISQNRLVQPENLELAYKKFIEDNIPELAMGSYSPDLKTIEDEWEIRYEKLNTDNEDYITYLNGIKQVVDEYRKGLAKVKLMKENLNKPQRLNESETATIGEFIKYACKNLAIQNPPRNLTLSYDTNQVKDRRSFGYFDPNNHKIWVYVKNRNMADILRTLAHELVHHKQNLDGRISYESGKTGSDIENEANAKAGILLRDFGKKNNEIYQ